MKVATLKYRACTVSQGMKGCATLHYTESNYGRGGERLQVYSKEPVLCRKLEGRCHSEVRNLNCFLGVIKMKLFPKF